MRVETMEQKTSGKPRQLLLKEIASDPDKFQWRVSQFNKVESAEHIRTLTRAIRGSDVPFEPLLVFSMDGRFYVLDGHHRLAAYHKARWKKPIPVRVFDGTLEQARLAALEGNIRDKLRMSGPEKREAAWKLVKEDKLSKAEIVNTGAASEGTVAAMRRVLKRLLRDGFDLTGVSWTKARRAGSEYPDLDPEDWMEKKARKIVDALLVAKIGQGFGKDPDITALALQMLNPSLPGALVRQWWMEDPDLKRELADELRREEHPYELLEEPEHFGDASDL